jgi:queuine/archaeosine tRNA-ribosyltransferase
LQNLSFYTGLMSTARKMIREHRFPMWKEEMLQVVTTKL